MNTKSKKILTWDDILNNNVTGGSDGIDSNNSNNGISNNSLLNNKITKEKIIEIIGNKDECNFGIKDVRNTCLPKNIAPKILGKIESIINNDHMGGNKNAQKNKNTNANRDTNTDTNTDTNANTSTNTDTNANTSTDTDTNTSTNTNTNAKTNTNTDTDINTDTNANNINIKKIKTYFDCDNDESEKCILKKIKIDPKFNKYFNIDQIDDLIKRYFKPEGPKDTFNFLSNHNIDNVLNQFFYKYNDDANKFYNIPFQLRDFEQYGTDLSKMDFYKEITENHYKTFGVVINTDNSFGSGIHWFCLFIDARQPEIIDIEYFNSSGRNPLAEIKTFLHNLDQELKHKFYNKKTINIKYSSNVALQEDNHSCGVWSLAYIWLRLEGVPAEWFNPSNIDDSVMHLLRKYFFTNDEKDKRTYGGNKKLDKSNKYL
jgi:hypothetical protein